MTDVTSKTVSELTPETGVTDTHSVLVSTGTTVETAPVVTMAGGFATVVDLVADVGLSYTKVSAGSIIVAGYSRYEVVASGTASPDVTTAGGVKLNLVSGATALVFVPTRTEIKALVPSANDAVILTESGREGLFVWRAADYSAEVTADTQEGLYLKADSVASTAGAWVRDFDSVVDAKWFGVVADNATDDGPALNAAIQVVDVGTEIKLPTSGTMLISTSVLVDRRVVLDGGKLTYVGPGTANEEGAAARISGAIVGFNLTADAAVLSGFKIYGDRTTGQYGVRVQNARCGLYDMTIEMVDYGFRVSGGNSVSKVKLYNVNARNIVTTAYWLEDCALTEMNDCIYATETGTYAECTTGLHIQSQGNIITNCNILQCVTGLHFETASTHTCQHNFVIGGSYDTCTGAGIRISNSDATYKMQRIWFTGVWAGTNLRGVHIDGATAVDGVYWTGGTILNSTNENIYVQNQLYQDVEFKGVALTNANVGAVGANNVNLDGAGEAKFLDCTFGREMGFTGTYFTHIATGANQSGDVITTGSTFDSGAATAAQFIEGGSGRIIAPQHSPGALVYLTANENATGGVVLVVPWDAAEYDNGGYWSGASATRFTVPVGVTKVRITLCAIYNQVGNVLLYVNKNGATFAGRPTQRIETTAAINYMNMSTAVIEVDAGDYFEAQFVPSATGAFIGAGTKDDTWMCIEAVG